MLSNTHKKIVKIVFMRLIFIFIILMTYLKTTYADDLEDVDVLVGIKGQCKKFTIGQKNHKCSAVIYSHFNNGRVAYNIPTEYGALMLSGGKGSQLEATSFTLLIDKITITSGKVNNRYEASGKCQMIGSVDGELIHELNCQASNGVENIIIHFIGDGNPVDHIK